MNIYEKLYHIQQELKAPKNQKNSFGGYTYRSCEDILEAVKPLLAKYKCVLLLEDNIEVKGEDRKEDEKGNVVVVPRTYVKATATLKDIEMFEENDAVKLLTQYQITNTAYAREEAAKKGMDGSQITGASSSYARKYCLSGLLAIDDNKDSDATNTGSIYKCENCGKPFVEGDYSGKHYTAKDLYEMAKQKNNGVALCKECNAAH